MQQHTMLQVNTLTYQIVNDVLIFVIQTLTVIGDDEQGERLIQDWYEKSGKAAAKTSKDLLKSSKLAEGEIR